MSEIAATMLIEEVTGTRAYLSVQPPVIPNVGDRLQCTATVYLHENVMKVLSPSEQIGVIGTVIERTFIQRGESWVCHLKLNHHAFIREPAPRQQAATGAEGE